MTPGTTLGTAPWWRLDQHPRSLVPIAAITLFFVAGTAGQASGSVCSATRPCQPDWHGSILLGLLLPAAAAIFIDRWSASFLAIVMTATWLAVEFVDPGFQSWVLLCVLAYAALCLRVAARPGRPDMGSSLTLPVPEAPPRRGRLGRGWRLLAATFSLVTVALIWSTVGTQRRVQAQEETAGVESAQVVDQPSPYTIRVRFAGGSTAVVDVVDASRYPIGSDLDFYLDDAGLRQPVSEPYDVTPLLIVAELAGGLALASGLRARRFESGLREFLRTPQPARLVRVVSVNGIVAIFGFEATSSNDRPYLYYPAISRLAGPPTGPSAADETPEEAYPQIATLYGLDAPDNWCAAEVDGVLLTPARPVRATAGAGAEPEPLDAAVELATLRPADRIVSYDLITHQRGLGLGIAQTLAFVSGLSLIVGRLLPALNPAILGLVCAVIVALGGEFGWRTLLRPRLTWNAAGLAALTALGGFTVPWAEVTHVATGKTDVTVVTDDGHAAVVPARRDRERPPTPERTSRELSRALRYARQNSVPGVPPAVPAARRPPQLLAACLVAIPLLTFALVWVQSI